MQQRPTESSVSAPAVALPPLGIIAGGGSLPATVARAARSSGRQVFVIALAGFADPQSLQDYPCAVVRVGKAGEVLALLRQYGCTEVVMIGTLVRPALRDLGFDFTTLRLLAHVAKLYHGGDDKLLSGIAKYMETRGLRVLGAHEIAPEILMPLGPLASHKLPNALVPDAVTALAAIAALGPWDVGQGMVIVDGRIVAVEGAEGTDRMLHRVRELQDQRRLPRLKHQGLLVKAPKPQQDHRIDLPAIGARTVEAAAQAGLAGICVAAGGVIVAEPQEMIRAADLSGLFVEGIAWNPSMYQQSTPP